MHTDILVKNDVIMKEAKVKLLGDIMQLFTRARPLSTKEFNWCSNTLVVLRKAAALANICKIWEYLQCHVVDVSACTPGATLCFCFSQLLTSLYCHRRWTVIIILAFFLFKN